MALTPEQIDATALKCSNKNWVERGSRFNHDFAQAIEAEVRKQDDALIRNFVAAIKLGRHDWEDWPEDSRKAFEALRARLGDKP